MQCHNYLVGRIIDSLPKKQIVKSQFNKQLNIAPTAITVGVPYYALFLYVILSGVQSTQSKFYRAESEVKPRSDSDDGISFEISVACQWDVTSIQKAT